MLQSIDRPKRKTLKAIYTLRKTLIEDLMPQTVFSPYQRESVLMLLAFLDDARAILNLNEPTNVHQASKITKKETL